MSERVQALRSKLPEDVLARIARYDSHPAADLIRKLEFRAQPRTSITPDGLRIYIQAPAYFVPLLKEVKRIHRNNRTQYLRGGVWQPLLVDPRAWQLTFDRWRFDTMPELHYLPDWVTEQYGSPSEGVADLQDPPCAFIHSTDQAKKYF